MSQPARIYTQFKSVNRLPIPEAKKTRGHSWILKKMPSTAQWRHGLSSALVATCLLFNNSDDIESWLRYSLHLLFLHGKEAQRKIAFAPIPPPVRKHAARTSVPCCTACPLVASTAAVRWRCCTAYGWIGQQSSSGFCDIARPTLGVFASLDRF
jgi:hypothetical protein